MREDEIINKFWNEVIYNSNRNNIYNDKINLILSNISKLNKILNSHTLFGIGENLQLEVFDSKLIIKDIDKIKKDNIFYLKTHVESIPEYFKYLFDQNIYLSNEKNIIISESDIIILYGKNLDSSEKDLIISDNFNICKSSSNINNSPNLLDYIKSSNSSEYFNFYNKDEKKILVKVLKEFSSNLIFNENDSMNKDFLKKIKLKIKSNFKNIYVGLKILIKNNFNNKKIILLDSENLLKSFKIQNFLKKIIGEEEFNKYYEKWTYGDYSQIYKVDFSASLTEYTNSIKYTEPYSSIGLDLTQKKYLIDIFISNYLNDFYIIYFLNTKFAELNNNSESFEKYILTNNSLFLPIIYDNKNDIREQDDYLLIFLYEFLNKKKINSIIISGDKFKFYKKNVKLKNIYNLYEIENLNLKIYPIICNQSFSDIFKMKDNSNYYQINKNFPIIEIQNLIFNKEKIDLENVNEIISLFLYNYFDYVYKLNEKDIDVNKIIKNNNQYIKNLLILLNNSIKIITQLNYKFKIVFNFLENKSKKDIIKLVITDTDGNNSKILPNSIIDKFDFYINEYKKILHIYLIAKSFKLLYGSQEYVIKLSKLFTLLIYLYDLVDLNIFKIKKLSNKNSGFNNVFLKFNSIFKYIKKIGLLKKNY